MIFLVFALGLIVGSFLNVVVFRLNTGESLIIRGSRCFFCNKKLQWYELVPVISFIIQRGKCCACGSKIPLQYPVTELTTGIVFALVWWRTESLLLTSYFLLIFSVLLAISAYDFRHKIIPDKLVYPLIVLTALASFLNILGSTFHVSSWLRFYFMPALAYFLFFAGLWFFSRGAWMGFGDAKLSLAIAFLLAWPASLWALVFSFWIGGIVGIVGLLFKKFSLKTQVSFGPFMALGTLLAFLLF